MKLDELINKMNKDSHCVITISAVCDEYIGGIDNLKQEVLYKSHCNDEVYDFTILLTASILPELVICTVRK